MIARQFILATRAHAWLQSVFAFSSFAHASVMVAALGWRSNLNSAGLLMTWSLMLIGGTALVLIMIGRSRSLASPRSALAAKIAAIGLTCFGLGQTSNWILDIVRQDRSLHAALTRDETEASLIGQLFPDGAIRTGEPDDRTVCHDFAFGGTRYSDGSPVSQLLADYHQVSRPRVGDIIVYWSDAGQAAHSGIVRAVGKDGLVVIESKWGRQGRFLHLTGISRYPATYTYYRKNSDASAPIRRGALRNR